MPDSMYDKLGDLLSEAIESGNFFDQIKVSEKIAGKESEYDEECIKNNTQNSFSSDSKNKKEENSSKFTYSTQDAVYKNIHLNNQNQSCIVSKSKKLIKYAHPEVQKACTFVGVNDDMDFEQAKKQYHKKLLRFHPDKNADNEVMRKITRKKTAELVQAWKIIEQWFNS